MAIPKVLGIEQEYAITFTGKGDIGPFDVSCLLINTYVRNIGLRSSSSLVTWDYTHETPFQDIRGPLFSKKGGQIVMSTEENQLINTVLPNGARLYTDHAHPEYSTPECISACQALAYDKAGERILAQAVSLLHQNVPELSVSLFKNNTDTYGHSYGTHENYLMEAGAHDRCLAEKQQDALRILVPFLVTRQVYTGAGKVGSKLIPTFEGMQVSQRSEYMENVFGLETMYARSIINTRGEHHADPERFRRLHLIVGDANMCQFAGFLKLGATQIVLEMMEEGFISENFALKDPVEAIRLISHEYNTKVELDTGKKLSAVDIQRIFLDHAVRFKDCNSLTAVQDIDTILDLWNYTLDGLDSLKLSKKFDLDDDPHSLRERVDWILKLWILSRQRRKRNISWKHPFLSVLNLQYHNIDSEKGLYYQIENESLTHEILDEEYINDCMLQPPDDTRAYVRGKCIQKYHEDIFLVNWEVIGFVDGKIHRMLPLLNPLKGRRDQFEKIFSVANNVREFIREVETQGN